MTTMEPPEKTSEWTPSEAYQRLEAEVEARRQKMRAEGQAPPDKVGGPEIESPAAFIQEFQAEMARRFGFQPLLPGEIEAYEQERKARIAIEAREREERWRRADFNRLCPARYREPWDWAKCKPELQSPEGRAEVQKVWEWNYGPTGLYVVGESGHSKTRAVFKLVERLVVKERRDVAVMDGIAFSNLCTKAFGTPDETEKILHRVVTAPVLVIDDLAKRWTPATEEGAFTVIDRRTAHCRPVIVTINYTATDLFNMQQARGEMAQLRDVATPLLRRLADYCTPVVL